VPIGDAETERLCDTTHTSDVMQQAVGRCCSPSRSALAAVECIGRQRLPLETTHTLVHAPCLDLLTPCFSGTMPQAWLHGLQAVTHHTASIHQLAQLGLSTGQVLAHKPTDQGAGGQMCAEVTWRGSCCTAGCQHYRSAVLPAVLPCPLETSGFKWAKLLDKCMRGQATWVGRMSTATACTQALHVV
jgi:hypothetical protein